MKFIDECKVEIIAGKGGDGVVSFIREARVSRGGPDGGDGGRGGSIFFIGDTGQNTLLALKYEKIIRGIPGENGRYKNQYGAKGEDKFFKVPLGTLVYHGENLVADIVDEKEYLIAKGGYGGKGNTKFKTSSNPAPRMSENGTPGERFVLTLSLKVLADIGFVGKPSAGKSTLLSKISNAKPKMAEYHFTTLTPQLGLVETDGNSFVAADLPGLIRGASEGKGLGLEFLKHIDRCKVIGHIIDFGDDTKNPIDDYEVIWNELKSYSLGLEDRSEIIVANKMDSPLFEENLAKFKKKFKKKKVISISALEEKGIVNLKREMFKVWSQAKDIEYAAEVNEITIEMEPDVVVDKEFEGMFSVHGTRVKAIFDVIPLNTYDNLNRFNMKLKNMGVWRMLEEKGVSEGDTVRIFDYEFDWVREA